MEKNDVIDVDCGMHHVDDCCCKYYCYCDHNVDGSIDHLHYYYDYNYYYFVQQNHSDRVIDPVVIDVVNQVHHYPHYDLDDSDHNDDNDYYYLWLSRHYYRHTSRVRCSHFAWRRQRNFSWPHWPLDVLILLIERQSPCLLYYSDTFLCFLCCSSTTISGDTGNRYLILLIRMHTTTPHKWGIQLGHACWLLQFSLVNYDRFRYDVRRSCRTGNR